MKTILVDAVHALVIPEKGIDEDMFELLEQLPNPKIILTGANKEQRRTFGLENLPYDLFTLEHNPEKTNPAYFKTLLKQRDLAAADVIYFEHDQAAIASAQSVGINAFYFDSEKRDLESLRAWLTENA